MTRVLLVLLLGLGSLRAAPVGAQPAGDPVLVAVGDIAPDPFRPWLGGQDDLATANLVETLAPDQVLALGDNQYEFGKLEAFTHPEGYAQSWGRQSIYDRTSPFTSLPCDTTSEQVRWLQQDRQAHAGRRCILACWPHQRWGNYFPDDGRQRYLWNALNHVRADLVLTGHEHSYARFTAMTWDGHVSAFGRGIRQIVVGTGGRSILPFTNPPRERTRYRDDQHFGVLKLTLRDRSWSSAFHRTDRTVDDSVAAGC